MSQLLKLFDEIFSPRQFFTNGEQGVWLDPSDFSTLYQDAAGTTPVTALGQPVGKILDKSGRGNHASQTTAASRPTVEARVNLATNSEGAAATWAAANVVDAASPIAGFPHSLQFGNNAVARYAYKTVTIALGTIYTTSIFVQMDDGLAPSVGTNSGSGDFCIVSDGFNNTNTATVQRISGDIYRVSSARTATIGGAARNCGVAKYTGQSARTFRVIGIQVEEGTTATTYQRVNTATDYVDVGAPRYLQFDGTDDGMATPSIDFTGTDKMTVWAGAKSNSTAANAVLFELSTTFGAGNPGSMGVLWPRLPYAVNFGLAGTAAASRSTSASADTGLRVISCAFDISASATVDEVKPRANGAVPSLLTIDAGPAGTGNYGNYPLYIGRRGGTSLPFNGRIYQLIVRGAASNAGQIAAGEAWVNGKTRAY